MRFDLIEALSLFDHARGFEHLQPLAKGGSVGVDRDDLPRGVFFRQLARGDNRGLRRAADAAGHADVEHIVALRERTFKVVRHQVGIDH